MNNKLMNAFMLGAKCAEMIPQDAENRDRLLLDILREIAASEATVVG
jgi:hypothetical protein